MATSRKLTKPGHGEGGLAVRPLVQSLTSILFLSAPLGSTFDSPRAQWRCLSGEMALLAVPLSRICAPACLSLPVSGVFFLLHLLFSAYCYIGDAGLMKGNSYMRYH